METRRIQRPKRQSSVRSRSHEGEGRIFSAMLKDLPEVRPLEKPLHPKRVRVLPPSKPTGSVSMWSSIDLIAPSHSVVISPSTTGEASALLSIKSEKALPILLDNIEPEKSPSLNLIDPDYSPKTSFKCSPAMYDECDGGSGSSTPGTSRGGSSLCGTPGKTSTRKRLAFTASPPSPSFGRELRDTEVADMLYYGSEEELDDEPENEFGQSILVIPRIARMFLDDNIEDDVDENSASITATVSLVWPPNVSSAPSPIPTAAPPSQVSSVDPPSMPSSHTGEPILPIASTNLEKFHFQWKGFPPSQISPAERREPFIVNNAGPTASYLSPFDAYSTIWDNDIMTKIAQETNAYAQQLAANMLEEGKMQHFSRINKWRDTTADELSVYFAIILATGVVVKSRLEEYWSGSQDIFFTPGFSEAMSIDRFLLLGKCLHFSNNDGCNPNRLTRGEAKLYKIQPIIDHFNHKFSSLYVLDRNIALDESLTMWKGWLAINQFIKNKAASVGIKTYEVCESHTGYLWRFEVHTGQEPLETEAESPISGKVASLVLRLLSGLEHKGYTVWMDNFYNSPALARQLKLRGFDCAGTLRTDRQFVPHELANLSKSDMIVGQVSGCTSGDVDLIVWRDKNLVAFVSTYHDTHYTRYTLLMSLHELHPHLAVAWTIFLQTVRL